MAWCVVEHQSSSVVFCLPLECSFNEDSLKSISVSLSVHLVLSSSASRSWRSVSASTDGNSFLWSSPFWSPWRWGCTSRRARSCRTTAGWCSRGRGCHSSQRLSWHSVYFHCKWGKKNLVYSVCQMLSTPRSVCVRFCTWCRCSHELYVRDVHSAPWLCFYSEKSTCISVVFFFSPLLFKINVLFFVHLWKNLHFLLFLHSLWSYLFELMRNHAVDFCKGFFSTLWHS